MRSASFFKVSRALLCEGEGEEKSRLFVVPYIVQNCEGIRLLSFLAEKMSVELAIDTVSFKNMIASHSNYRAT